MSLAIAFSMPHSAAHPTVKFILCCSSRPRRDVSSSICRAAGLLIWSRAARIGPATRLSRHEDSEGFARNVVRSVPCLCVHGKNDKAGTAHQPAGRRLFDPHRVCRGSRAPSMNSACTTCVRVLRPTAKTVIGPIDPKFWGRKYREA